MLSELGSGRQGRSARVSINLPSELHQRLLLLSEQQQRSLSNLCVVLLADAVNQASQPKGRK